MRTKQESSLTNEQIARLGNTVLYFATHIEDPNKTKLLKLVFLCEELSVKRHAVAFTGLVFVAWKFGPVQKQLWAMLEPKEYEEGTAALAPYVTCTREEGEQSRIAVVPAGTFDANLFTANELKILEELATQYKTTAALNALDLTAKKGSLWFNAVKKEKGLLQRFELGKTSKSHQKINFADLIPEGQAKKDYEAALDFDFFDGPSGKR